MPSSTAAVSETTYNPIDRGAYPVGVRTVELRYGQDSRTIPVELWYPAASNHAGEDLDASTQDTFEVLAGMLEFQQAAVRDAAPASDETFPLIVFSHGNGGHRCQSTFFCTHLASHGYIVASADHLGNTAVDLTRLAALEAGALTRGAIEAKTYRVGDVRAIMDGFSALDPAIGALWDGERIGLCGHSFGGWTTIVTTCDTSPVSCALAFAPVGHGRTLLFGGEKTYEGFTLEKPDRVPTLIVAGERDALVELKKVEWLYEAIGDDHVMFVLEAAGHFHFCDRVELIHNFYKTMLDAGGRDGTSEISMAPFEELVGEQPTQAFLCGIGTAHFDLHLRGHEPARAIVQNAPAIFSEHGARIRRH